MYSFLFQNIWFFGSVPIFLQYPAQKLGVIRHDGIHTPLNEETHVILIIDGPKLNCDVHAMCPSDIVPFGQVQFDAFDRVGHRDLQAER